MSTSVNCATELQQDFTEPMDLCEDRIEATVSVNMVPHTIEPMEMDNDDQAFTSTIECSPIIEDDIEIIEVTETPRKSKLRKRLSFKSDLAARRLKALKCLQGKYMRLKSKSQNLHELVEKLKKDRFITEEQRSALAKNTEAADIIKALQKKSENKNRAFKKYPQSLRKFAVTLHFYSPSAYKYARQMLNGCLPHPSCITKWYQNINGEPGFTAESFQVLKTKASKSNHKLLCNLVLDEMAIRQQVIFEGDKYQGYIDLGHGVKDDCQEIATSALVIMLVCINDHWKLPIGYFLVNGINAEQKTTLIKMSLEKCAEAGIEGVSMTFDGCPTHLSVMKLLGCEIEDLDHVKTDFPHPKTEKPVVVLLDACHMLKLVPKPFADQTDWPGVGGGGSPASGDGESPARGGEDGSGRGGEGACAACGGDVGELGRRVRGSPAEELIEAAIFPRELNDTTLLCSDCYKRYCNKGKQTSRKNPPKSTHSKGTSRRVALSEESANVNVSTPPTSDVSAAPQQTIILPYYKRATCRSERCLFPNCPTTKLHMIPQYMKQCLLRDYKLYTPEHSQVCTEHLVSEKWKTLLTIAKSDFTAQQIEDVISLSTANISAFNFNNIEDIPPNLLIYCTGFKHRQLKKILDQLPLLKRKTKTPVLALTAYLTKLRTNDSLDRLSTLFQAKTSILKKLTTVAKECMLKEFVPDYSKIPSPTAKAKKASGVVTEDDRILKYLQEHYYGNGSAALAAAALYPRLDDLASSKLSQCRKRKNSSDSDEDSLASKVRAKKCEIQEEIETNDSKNSNTSIEIAIEFERERRVEAGSESSEDEEESEQPRVKEEPDGESEAVDEGETGDPEDQHLVYAPKPTEDLLVDPLDTVPAPLLEHVKIKEDPVTVKVEPGEGDSQHPPTPTAGTLQSSTCSSYTVYYTKGVNNFIQGPTPKPHD